jgi:pimeloyl-ACP methyl ester carboxylesterase
MGILHSSTTTKHQVEELKRQQLRSAEARLLQLYPPPDDAATTTVIEVVSTNIPAVLLSSSSSTACHHLNNNNNNNNYRHLSKEDDENDEDDSYSIHSLKITTRRSTRQEPPQSPVSSQPPLGEEPAEPPPLVLLHGYMNGAGYFYRNFAGLARSFPQLYALDLLGWGLSSRPPWPPRTAIANDPDPIAASERFFVDSLEAWRQAERIDKMILAGHSMGGYLAVAYAERYPHRVDQLVLLSPVGVPVASSAETRQKRLGAQSISYRIAWGLYEWVFRWCTPGDLLRLLPESVGRYRLQQYVERRLPAIDQKEEQSLLTHYLYHNGTLSGSGEYCLPHLLTASLFGKRPLVDRIPHLPIAACHFFYGEHDWMDAGAALDVQERCRYPHHHHGGPANDDGTMTTTTTTVPPKVTVHQVRHAGHLLMLDNPEEFNNGLAKVAARSPVLVGSIPQELFRPPRMTTNITAVSSSMQDE